MKYGCCECGETEMGQKQKNSNEIVLISQYKNHF